MVGQSARIASPSVSAPSAPAGPAWGRSGRSPTRTSSLARRLTDRRLVREQTADGALEDGSSKQERYHHQQRDECGTPWSTHPRPKKRSHRECHEDHPRDKQPKANGSKRGGVSRCHAAESQNEAGQAYDQPSTAGDRTRLCSHECFSPALGGTGFSLSLYTFAPEAAGFIPQKRFPYAFAASRSRSAARRSARPEPVEGRAAATPYAFAASRTFSAASISFCATCAGTSS